MNAPVTSDDLRAAVAAGVLSEEQAARLVALSHSRRGARESATAGDEPFELFKGFNEIFIVTGLVILTLGWLGVVALWAAATIDPSDNPAWLVAQVALAGAAILWALSEYFVRRRRMVAPAITLAVLWAGNAALGFIGGQAGETLLLGAAASQAGFIVFPYGTLTIPLALTTLAVGAYWLRFRVPFAMAMIALGLFATALVLAAARAGTPSSPADLFLLSGSGPFAWITLLLGLGVFAVAMAFDMSDPHRVTRRAANGFWLHVVAAPALVNTVALTLLSQGTAQANVILSLFLAFIALVAVVIDRRSFLIAGVGYCVTLAGTVFGGSGSAFTVLVLGVVLLLLGAFWERIRRRLLHLLPLPVHRLPPAA
ncbi:hypothetical protein FHG66_14975 [Rubellimicrobium rubrum]|uniref:DUF2157 domain-containing protein n=1 Tax=Rubellimicrobium rubrum TaxID=2585369 RepID=A0A5C4MQJ7_9RHOB|nr:hypothetical protein [Rubellimicrobium rubrum]TNC48175.1 hypothetical protein FHG66_14975 [Rubellimicrobium rubrum]